MEGFIGLQQCYLKVSEKICEYKFLAAGKHYLRLLMESRKPIFFSLYFILVTSLSPFLTLHFKLPQISQSSRTSFLVIFP